MNSPLLFSDRLDWSVVALALCVFALCLILWGRAAAAEDVYTTALPAFGQVTRRVDGINTVRGTDMLVVYTPAAGRPTTRTNQWGLEAVVQGGRVVSVGGNDQPIPQDGFVISAHGAAIAWLQANVSVGAKAELNGAQLTITVDATTHAFVAERAIDHAAQQLADNLPMLGHAAREKSSSLLAEAEAALEQEQYATAIRLAGEARYAAVPSVPLEVRGVWHRPVELTPAQIRVTLDRLKDAGFNALFLESFYTGYAIYPSQVAPQNPQFIGWDPLAVWAEEAAARGIELHLWVHVFHLGRVTVDRHPLWANLQRDGSLGATLEPGLYYGDPGHPEVREYVFSIIREMVERYPVAGLHLDYIRYPATNSLENTSGYSPASRQRFKELTGYDPLEISPATHPQVWARWIAWQEENVTSFVQQVHEWIKAEHPDLILSAAVVPDIDEAIRTKRQNWRAWVEAGWLDLLTPMIYSLDDGYVAKQIAALRGRTGSAWFVPGIAPYMGMSAHKVIDQVTISRQAGQPGVVMFALHSIDLAEMQAYKAGLFSLPAVTPWRKAEAVGAFAAWVIEGMNRWVAEDILPSHTALALDNLAHEMAAWRERGGEAMPAEAWVAVLREAKASLEGPFYGQRSRWLQQQIGVLIDVLTWRAE